MIRQFQLFPALDAATEAALRASIARWGVLVPIVKDQHGAILDGHHRARIADELGVDYQTTRIELASDADRIEVARTLNTDRRQLDAEQRRQMAAQLRQEGHSLRAIGGALGVSEGTVRTDLATAQDYAVPERIIGLDGKSRPAQVQTKNRREDDRAQAALAGLDDGVLPGTVVDVRRLERLRREHEAELRRAQPVEPLTDDDVEIRHGDFREVLDDLAGTVDAIITDPPYEAAFVDTFADLADLAARLLTPDGVLAVMTGGLYLPRYLEHLGRTLEYRWTCAYLTPGPNAAMAFAAVAQAFKPVVLFQRPGAARRFIGGDVYTSDGDDKAHHHWGQDLGGFRQIVDRLTRPGELIVDPCLGGGTTALACRDLGRRFVGCDVDPAAIHATRERLA